MWAILFSLRDPLGPPQVGALSAQAGVVGTHLGLDIRRTEPPLGSQAGKADTQGDLVFTDLWGVLGSEARKATGSSQDTWTCVN